jgi:hypothetical protein
MKDFNKLVNKFNQMYDKYIQLLMEDRLQEAAEIGLELAEFNTEIDLFEASNA